MKTTLTAAALSAAFFVSGPLVYADTATAESSLRVLVKQTAAEARQPTFAPKDFPWGLPEGRTEDVYIPLGNAVLTMPWMEVEKAGEESIFITTPRMIISEDSDFVANGGVIFEEAELQIRNLNGAMATSGFAKSMSIGSGDAAEGSADLEGFEFAMTARNYELALAAMNDRAESGSEQMMAAMAALDMSLDYSLKSSRFTILNKDRDVPFSKLLISSGPTDSGISFGNGRMQFSAEATDNAVEADGPLPVEAKIGSASYNFAMPIEASKAPQPMDISVAISEVSVSDSIWALADPKGIFPRAFDQAKVDMAVNVILNKSMFDTAKKGPSGDSIQPVDMALKALEFDGLGLDVSANADVEMEGEMPTDISAFLSVAGLSEFMKNVVKAGFLPQPQAIMAEGVALQFGKEEDDGSLTFNVKTEGNMIMINGNPVVPLPQ